MRSVNRSVGSIGPVSAPSQRVSLGDRVERALEDRFGVERELELERGEVEASATPSLRQTVFWLAVTAISL